MAFKMKGAPYIKEGKDTYTYKEEVKIADIQDKIGFIEEDITNNNGKMTPTQRVDLANLKQKLRAIRKA